jgi:hypothetical protein
LKHPIAVAYLPKAFYHYIQDANANSLVKRGKNYEERLYVKDKFCQLMSNHKYYNICLNTMVVALVSGSYNRKLFSSSEFKKKFFNYRHKVLFNKNLTWHYRIRLYFSCIGCYVVVLYLQDIISKCRRSLLYRKY